METENFVDLQWYWTKIPVSKVIKFLSKTHDIIDVPIELDEIACESIPFSGEVKRHKVGRKTYTVRCAIPKGEDIKITESNHSNYEIHSVFNHFWGNAIMDFMLESVNKEKL